MKQIRLTQIRKDIKLQPRAVVDSDVVADYAEQIRSGADFPPVGVVYDGQSYWLWDGYHRVEAYASAGAVELPANVDAGTAHDAFLKSLGANATHGQRRSNADKRRAVELALADDETCKLSDRQIADICQVSQPFVSSIRPSGDNRYHLNEKRTGSDGKKYPPTQPPRSTEDTATASEAKADITDDVPPPAPVNQDGEPAQATVSPTQTPSVFDVVPTFQSILNDIVVIRKRLTQLANQPGGEVLAARLRQIHVDVDNTQIGISGCCPNKTCDQCGGAGCNVCGMRGWTVCKAGRRIHK